MFWFSSCLTRLNTKYHWCWHDLSILSPNIYIPYELVCWVSSGTSLNTGKDALPDARLGAPEGGHVKPWPYVPGENPVVVQSLSRVRLFAIPWTIQARILEWVAFPFSRGSSQPWDWTQVSSIAGGFFTSSWDQSPNAGALGSIPRSHILQLKIPHATMKMKETTCPTKDPVQPNK